MIQSWMTSAPGALIDQVVDPLDADERHARAVDRQMRAVFREVGALRGVFR
jgi:hypothetical protein